MDKTYKVKVNNTFDFVIDTRNTALPDMIKTGQGSYHILKNHQSLNAEILETDFLRKTYTVSLDGEIYTVKISDALDQLIEDMGFARGEAGHVSEITAPMPGLVLDIQAETGQHVEENDTLIVLEAMKMENIILSPRSGLIKSIMVARGDAVDKDQLLIAFEEG
ncbi:acetyl-CoA carboxylase biotin carboxyl carrier protein subunit [Sinomicrobium weinanense]|uniref:Acetyl-CoA carboxylase biotin carboxyl carrier protein subunit n=1 Tax=Sinomicrobium weinanense TaxID=2842200 RepID=A0A926JRT3_9FLAO|nr:acetyl-CoA carboxylase biotin carboxyl carrier protein subunit [Sinomicrobium weinanense]MBC9796201.1 acetyl-CoA carboxylase biotin carboxyl carrier protein subunit [Sinomicrobium weinanense]MBU3123480.1 acetyl-CoA carboxylase biotin carboxyl carrier protein subunit [Sinomicrobium weinanense]